MHNTFYTVNELLDLLSNPESWNKVKDMVRNGSGSNNPPEKETSKEETNIGESTNTLGSIFDEESLTQAIHQYENEINDETVAYQKVIEAKKEKINQLKARLVKEQMKSRVTQQGNDMAVTMVIENARKVADTLNSILNQENVPDKITITIPDVG